MDADHSPFPTEPDAQRRAVHFAALRALAEAASVRLQATVDAAETVRISGIGLMPADPAFAVFLDQSRQTADATEAALRDRRAAWDAFFDALLTDD